MEKIGDSADVARATVFNYFSRKEDLVDEWFMRRGGELAEILAEAERETTDRGTGCAGPCRVVASFYEEDPTTGRAIMPRIAEQWGSAAGLHIGVARPVRRHPAPGPATGGHLICTLDPVRAGLLIFDGYLGVVYRWVADEDGEYALEENLVAMLDLILAGIARERPAEASRKGRRTPTPTRR